MSIPDIPRALSVELLKKNIKFHLTPCQKLKFMLTHITVEPVVLLYAIPTVMKHLITMNLGLEKACRVNYHFNQSICDAMINRDTTGYPKEYETQVQQLVGRTMAIRTIIMGFFPALFMLFLGAWSDKNGRRKPLILFPILGEMLSCGCLFLCSYFFLELPIQAVVFSDAGPYCLSGGWFCLFLGVYSYVNGVSSEDDKTVRIGAVSVCQNISMTAGILCSGLVLKPLGFEGVFILSFCMFIVSLFYLTFMIEDTSVVKNEKRSFLQDFFDVDMVKQTFSMCFRDGPENRRMKMIIIMIQTMMIYGPFYGEFHVLYLFTRLKFRWNEVDFSIFNTFHFLIQLLGSIFALGFFSKYLKLDDAILGIIALVSKILSCFIYVFAPYWYFFYIGAFVEVFYLTSSISLRSIMSKIVSPSELGKSNSLFGVCESMSPMIFGPLYAYIYTYAINYFPGMFFMVSSVLYTIALFLFIWIYRLNKKDEKFRRKIDENIEQEENLLKKACFTEMKKSMEKLKSTQSLPLA